MKRFIATTFAALVICQSVAIAEEVRSQVHSDYAASLWNYLQKSKFESWDSGTPLDHPFGPPACHEGKTFANAVAVKTQPDHEKGSLLVTHNAVEGDDGVATVTVWYRAKVGFDAKRNDWYWALFSPQGNVIQTSADKNKHAVRGFYVQEEDGRLWVFHVHSPSLSEFVDSGDLAKRVTRVGAGPNGETLMSGEAADIDAYVAAVAPASEAEEATPTLEPAANKKAPQRKGFVTMIEDGRLWVFKEGSEEFAAYKETGDLAKRVTRVGAGPEGETIMSSDAETIDAFLNYREGFATMIEDGRLWVFKEGSEELAAFKESGDLAKRVTRVGAGPDGMTIMAPDGETIDAYMEN